MKSDRKSSSARRENVDESDEGTVEETGELLAGGSTTRQRLEGTPLSSSLRGRKRAQDTGAPELPTLEHPRRSDPVTRDGADGADLLETSTAARSTLLQRTPRSRRAQELPQNTNGYSHPIREYKAKLGSNSADRRTTSRNLPHLVDVGSHGRLSPEDTDEGDT